MFQKISLCSGKYCGVSEDFVVLKQFFLCYLNIVDISKY